MTDTYAQRHLYVIVEIYGRMGAVIKPHALEFSNMGITQINATSEQTGEENIWTQEGRRASSIYSAPNIMVIKSRMGRVEHYHAYEGERNSHETCLKKTSCEDITWKTLAKK
jgi:hypothetical protein